MPSLTTDSACPHCLVEDLLDGRSSIERLIRSIVIIVMLEPSQPAPCAGWTPPPNRVKAVDPHCHGLKQLLDQVTLTVVGLTAQLTPGESSQIPAGVDEKLGICALVFGGESVEERRPQNAKRSDGLHESFALVNDAGSVPRRLNTSILSSSFESASTAA